MATTAEEIVQLKDKIADLEERERASPADDRAGQIAIDGRIKAATELLTALISQQGKFIPNLFFFSDSIFHQFIGPPILPFLLIPAATVSPYRMRVSIPARTTSSRTPSTVGRRAPWRPTALFGASPRASSFPFPASYLHHLCCLCLICYFTILYLICRLPSYFYRLPSSSRPHCR